MALELSSRLRHAWDAFAGNRDPTVHYRTHYYGPGYGSRPDRARFTRGNEKSIVTAIYNKIAIDVSQLNFAHVKLDENERFIGVVKSSLNECLTLQANIDQTGRAFIQDAVMSMFDEGHVAIVATETTEDPRKTDAYDVLALRTGKVVEWYPEHVKVRVYNARTAKHEEIVLPKRNVAIIENPLYAVVNEKNSVMQRLIKKLNLLDVIDEQSGSGKLDMIIQLPYAVKTKARQEQAESRRKSIEDQVNNSKLGIAYIDATERITQLNRPVENNLLKQIEYLTNMGYSQLGITQGVMDGTADEKTMQNYEVGTVMVIANAIVDGLKRTFLSKTARTQGKSIMILRDVFKRAPLSQLAGILEQFTRNGIISENEGRQVIGYKPSDDEQADKLVNSNIKQPTEPPMEPGADPAADPTMDPAATETADSGSVMDMPISDYINQ